MSRPLSVGSLLILQSILLPFAAIADEPKSAPARFLLEWGKNGSGKGEFDFPVGIAIDPKGNIVVSDFYNSRIQRFNPDGKLLAMFEVLPNPGGIVIDKEGNIYLSHFSAMKLKEERKPDRISVYSSEGKRLREWGKSGTGDGEFDYPGGMTFGKENRLYVADQTNRRVQVFDATGKFLFKWGKYGTKEGEFGGNINPKSRVGGPQFIARDSEGNIYTTEGSVGRVQKFTSEGKFLLAWGDNEDKSGSFGGTSEAAKGLRGPVAIAIDEKDRVWISSVRGRIQQFTKEGKYLRGFGEEQGSKPGQFLAPHGIAVAGKAHIYVADSYNHRIQKFVVGE